MVENYENYTGIFDSYQKWRTFDVSTSVENVPNYSSFDFWLSRYSFTKLLEFPKALSKCMALVATLNSVLFGMNDSKAETDSLKT